MKLLPGCVCLSGYITSNAYLALLASSVTQKGLGLLLVSNNGDISDKDLIFPR